MRDVSPDELETLGDRFSVDVDETRAARLTSQVNDFLAELDRLETMPIRSRDPEAADGDRRWSRPTDDPHNTTVVECDVPPAGEGSLAGTTVGVKDIIAVAGVPMRCGSAVMGGYVPSTDATVVTRLPTVTLHNGTRGEADPPVGLQLVGKPFAEAGLLAATGEMIVI